MARKKQEEISVQKDYIRQTVEDVFSTRFETYAREIIPDRSLPDARDGLKPVQRRILYAMYHEGNTASKPYRKSAKTVGLVIGNYHPHGDSSVYEAMVRLSQDWKMRKTLVDMQGNNGSIDDDPAAAMRYTEARLSESAEYLLKDLDQDTVEYTYNFDDTELEPTVLPSAFPNLLVNGSKGMAIGYATNMPPHNLKEVIQAAIYRLNHPDCSLEELMEIVKGPDFPTGGIVMGKEGIRDMYEKGQGRFIIRSKVDVIESKTDNKIVISEIPYDVVKSDLVKQIDDIRLSKDVQGILDVRDESDRNGLKIVIDVRKENDTEMILNYLYKKTSLQVSYSANMTAIVNKRPLLMSLSDILDAYCDHRKEVITRRCRYQLDKVEARCHILEGLIKALSILDEIIALIRKSKDKADAKKNLMEAYGFSEKQAEAIVTLQLYRLSSTDIVELKEEFAKLISTRDLLKSILSSNDLLIQLICRELKEVSEKAGDERRSEIRDQIEELVISKERMIVNERVMLTVSRDGYVKRVSLRSFNASENMPCGIKEEDELIGYRECDILDQLLVITENGNYLSIPVYEIGECKWRDRGEHISSYTNLNGSEKILFAALVKTYETDAFVLTLSEKGMIKRTSMSALAPVRTKRLAGLMNLKKGDRLVQAALIYRNEDALVISSLGYAARYPMDQIPLTGLKAQGVKAMNLGKDDAMSAMCTLSGKEGFVCLFSSDLNSKRMRISELETSNRPVKGEMLYKKVKTKPVLSRYLLCGSTYDSFDFMTDKEIPVIVKDITLMDKQQGVSASLNLDPNAYLLRGIEEVRILDIVPEEKSAKEIELDAENSNGDYEVLTFNV